MRFSLKSADSLISSKFRLLAAAFVAGLLYSASASAQPDEADPWEGFNRKVYAFNEKADQYLTRPLAKTYRLIMPDPGERAVSRFFGNLGEVGNGVNHLLQGKGYSAANSAGRFLLNSTLGIGGLFDVADGLGLDPQDGEDLGQTLAVWGVESGPYLVIPFLGPSTLRDAPSRYPQRYLDPVTYLEDIGARNAATATEVISIRASLLDAERSLPENDPYRFVRDAWLQRRDYQIRDGEVEDEFGGDGFDDFLD